MSHTDSLVPLIVDAVNYLSLVAGLTCGFIYWGKYLSR